MATTGSKPESHERPGPAGLLAGGLGRATRDIVGAALRPGIWWALAWSDTQSRYRRTVLGPFWLTLSTAAMVVTAGTLYAGLLGKSPASYIPFVAVGVIVWGFISAALSEGCAAFIAAAGTIKSVPLALPIHIYRGLARNAIVLAHNALLLVALWAVLRWPIGWEALLALPGLALTILAVLGLVLGLAVLCARFRDIPQLVTALLQFLFVVTPIFWAPDQLRLPELAWIAHANPLYALIEVVRGPLVGQPPGAGVWITAALLAAAALTSGAALYGAFRHRIVYWL